MMSTTKIFKKKRPRHYMPTKYYRQRKEFFKNFTTNNNLDRASSIESVLETDSSPIESVAEKYSSTNSESVNHGIRDLNASILTDHQFNNNNNQLESRENISVCSVDSFFGDLHQWALTFKVNHNALSALLCLLRERLRKNLPKDARTLLQTPRQVIIKEIKGGQFWYHGIRNALLNSVFSRYSQNSTIVVNFNMDGLPLYRSSKKEFWPILMNVKDMAQIKPMIVAIFHGNSKPVSREEYLREFVEELNALQRDGVQMPSGAIIKIKLGAFICDSPARAFVKCCKAHNAYSGCTKCVVIGDYDLSGKHMSYSRLDCPLRTHEDFIKRRDEDHHLYDTLKREYIKSPLEDIDEIDMIKSFPVGECMHLIELGIVKRCLKGWIYGAFNFRSKFTAQKISTISLWMIDANNNIPKEFTRGSRSLDEIAHWKAIEFRNFLLYFGPVVLQGFLQQDMYDHFLYLSMAIRILSCDELNRDERMKAIVRNLLMDYIEIYKDLYGLDSINSNVHNLSHLIEDINYFGSLRAISAYPFESALGTIKRNLKSYAKPLAQAAKRIVEMYNREIHEDHNENAFPVLQIPLSKIESYEKPFWKIQFKTFMLTAHDKNKWFLTKDHEIVGMDFAVKIGVEIFVIGKKLKTLCAFFKKPFSSHFLNIYRANPDYTERIRFNIYEIKAKMVKLDCHDSSYAFFPMLHTF